MYATVDFRIKGQVKDEEGGFRTAQTIEAELNLIAKRYGLEIDGEVGV